MPPALQEIDLAALRAVEVAAPPRRGRQLVRVADRVVKWGFVTLLVLAPLPFGSNTQFGWNFLALATSFLLFVWSLRTVVWARRESDVSSHLNPALAMLSVVIGWIAVQTTTFTPTSWHHPVWANAAVALGQEAVHHPVWANAAVALGQEAVRGSISVNPYATGTGLLRLLTYAGAFWLALQLARVSGGAQRIVSAIAIAGVGYATYGIFAHLVTPTKILWYEKWYELPGLNSTFVNQNSYATYAGLGLLTLVGLIVTTINRERHRSDVPLPRIARRKLALRVAPMVAATVVIAIALLLTTSRAGNASTAVGLAVLIAALGTTRLVDGRRAAIAAIGLLVIGTLVLAIAGDDLSQRLIGTDLEKEGRFPVYERILEGVARFPLTGAGYGTFAESFRFYIGELSELHWDQAHNTYLELLFELGLPATALLLGAVAVPIVICARHVRERARSALYPCLALATTALVGVHALLDFSLEMPAIALTYFAILGVGCARSLPSHRRKGLRPSRTSQRRRRWYAPALVSALALLLVALSGPRLASHTIALPALLMREQLRAGAIPSIAEVDRAIASARKAGALADKARLDTIEGQTALSLAERRSLTDHLRRTWYERAAQAYRQSLARAPANPPSWAQLAYATLLVQPYSPLIDQALAMSVITGANLVDLVAFRSMVAAAAWDRLSRRTRALYSGEFIYGLRKRPVAFANALAHVKDVEMVRRLLKSDPALLAWFDRARRIAGATQSTRNTEK